MMHGAFTGNQSFHQGSSDPLSIEYMILTNQITAMGELPSMGHSSSFAVRMTADYPGEAPSMSAPPASFVDGQALVAFSPNMNAVAIYEEFGDEYYKMDPQASFMDAQIRTASASTIGNMTANGPLSVNRQVIAISSIASIPTAAFTRIPCTYPTCNKSFKRDSDRLRHEDTHRTSKDSTSVPFQDVPRVVVQDIAGLTRLLSTCGRSMPTWDTPKHETLGAGCYNHVLRQGLRLGTG
jgi:hypothetical protein